MLDDAQDLFERAVMLVWQEQKASSSFVQRQLGISYNAAMRLFERMEQIGIVSAPNHVGKRSVRSPDDIRRALSIRDEIWAIAEGDGVQASVMLNAIKAGLGDVSAPAAVRRKKGKPPMKADPEFDKMSEDAHRVTAEELRQFIERYERLEAEKKDITNQQAEVMAEAKGRGYDTKVLKKIIALRKREPDEVAEEQAVMDLYKAALGMD